MTANQETPTPRPTPSIKWMPPSQTDPVRRLAFWLQGNPSSGRCELHAGDGKWVSRTGPGAFAHAFPSAGYYVLTARETGNGDLIDSVRVLVRDTNTPNVQVGDGTDVDDWEQKLITFPNDVDTATLWEIAVDDEPIAQHWVEPGGQVGITVAAGEHTLHVTDVHAQQKSSLTFTVQSPYDPEFDLTGTGADYMSVECTLVRTSAKALTIDWGDGQTTKVASPAAGQKQTHKYTSEGARWITVTYDDESGAPRRQPYYVPWGP